MLWIEATSVSVIVIVVALLLFHNGAHWDWDELRLRGMTGSGLRLGLVLALFSYVGFESATTLGTEAHDPLNSIPRAVIQSSLLADATPRPLRASQVMALEAGKALQSNLAYDNGLDGGAVPRIART